MTERPDIVANAKIAIACEHFGAVEWKDDSKLVYKATGKLEPMWTMALVPAVEYRSRLTRDYHRNSSKDSDALHEQYLGAFAGTPDSLRMALIAPGYLNGSRSMW
jgi:hypothetical protein